MQKVKAAVVTAVVTLAVIYALNQIAVSRQFVQKALG